MFHVKHLIFIKNFNENKIIKIMFHVKHFMD